MNKEAAAKLADRSRRQIIMLAVIFLVGMAVNILGMPSETQGMIMTLSNILTGLHALIGIGLITGGILTLRIAYKSARKYVKLAWSGFVAVLAAFVAGIAMMATESDWWSFVMATAFLAAMLLYGAIVVKTQKEL